MKTGVYLKWTLWKNIETPLFTFEMESTRYWKSWDDEWKEAEQAENGKPEVDNNYNWNNASGWDRIAAFNDKNLNPENPDLDKWNTEEWDQQQQNPTWLDIGRIAVPDFIITALCNIDTFEMKPISKDF